MISPNNGLKVIVFVSIWLLCHFIVVAIDQVSFEPFKSHFHLLISYFFAFSTQKIDATK